MRIRLVSNIGCAIAVNTGDDAIYCPAPRALILGIGNVLLSDEGAGIHVANLLQRNKPGGHPVTVLDGGTLSFTLLADIAACDQFIAVDAAELNAQPGTVRVLEGADMDRHLRSGRKSVHEVGLADLLDMARLTDRLPVHRALVAIQPADLGWGDGPSPAVAGALTKAQQAVWALLDRWSTFTSGVKGADTGNDHDAAKLA